MTTFLCYDKCSTCQKAQKWLDEQLSLIHISEPTRRS